VTSKACRYKSPKAINELKKALSGGREATSDWYKGPSLSVTTLFLGYKNRGNFNSRPKMRRTTTFPGDFCLNNPITWQCY
jgi:hypothetical protein